ncbi:MAG: DegQ family serine endoprotease [Verrucomicrobiota bacterium]
MKMTELSSRSSRNRSGGRLTFYLMAGLMALAEGRSWGAGAVPDFKTDNSPINREGHPASSYAPIIKKASPSVVNIYSSRTVRMPRMRNPFGGGGGDPFFRRFFGQPDDGQDPSGPDNRQAPTRKEQSLGSGVIVSPDGYILTANHVVDGADDVKVGLTDEGKKFTAKVIGTDRATDVAVLKIEGKDLPAITITDSDKLEVGDVVIAIGNPFGVGQTVTMGIVSAVGRQAVGINQYENFIQTDAAINPGNSGGALIDTAGRLVGINTAIFSRSGGNEGIGFVVPVNLAKSVMERLIKYGKVTRGYLGVRLQPDITPELAEEFKLPDTSGAMVTEVTPDSPGAKAGLQSGDVIRELNGKKVTDMRQLRLTVSQTAPGTKVELKILRGEEGKKPAEKTVTVTLGTLPDNLAGGPGRMGPDEDNSSDMDALDGVEVSDLDAPTRQQMKIPENVRGALVTSVDPNSNSADADVRRGDVILEINHHAVRNADDAVELSKQAKGARVLLRVWRNGGSFFITVDNTKKK